jgi:peptidoglycan/LPS O-acetylase OafA/YrhL
VVTVSGHILTRDEPRLTPTESAHSAETPADRHALRFVPGLDGLRGVAVLAVMGFHAGLGPVNGGLLGVDMFFVLSGFLVTSLLLVEHARTGTIKLLGFWGRRARRLLPALLVLLIGIGAYARWVGGGVPPAQLRGDALFTLGYSANWHFIATGQNYFVQFGALSPLLHTWSLAVEEQFYLVWPVVVLVVLRRFGRRGVGWAAGVIGTASAALCAGLYLTGASIDRLYYGTDTRAQSIMVGAVLAVVVPMSARTVRPGSPSASSGLEAERSRPAWWYPTRPRCIAVLGLIGAFCLLWALHAVRGNGALLYEGGFLLVALCTAAVIASTVELPRAALTRALCFRPLRYTGRISYGLYLYHWPLFLVLDGTRTGLTGAALLGVRVGATFGVAALSYRFVELPVRAWGRSGVRRRALLAWATLSAALLGLVVAVLLAATVTPGEAVLPIGSRPPTHFVGPGGVDAVHPEHALLLGDSIALTLGIGLGQHARAWGITLDNKSAIGCDLDPATTVNVMGTVSPAAGGCPDWRPYWSGLVGRERPDVVVVLLGRWESIDRLYGGRWTHVGEAAFDRHLVAELGQVIDIGSAHGAKVAMLTLPYIAQTTEQPDGSPWDMNLPSRTNAYNADVRRAVAEHPHQASVIDLNKLLDPQGHYTSYIHGVRVRSFDDEHISTAGGQLLRSALLPELVDLGLPAYQANHRDVS